LALRRKLGGPARFGGKLMNFVMLEQASGLFGNSSFLIIIVVMLGAMYLLMWRPQKKKEKQATELRNSIEIGDEVTTIGGIVGRVVSVKEDTFIIETAGERSRMRFKRWAVQEVGKLNLESASAGIEPAANTQKPAEKKGFFGFGKKKDDAE
jgi:preprotein translocase subunit YajC